MITLREKGTNQLIGQINETQLKFLQDHLEEETETDDDYYLTPDTIDMLADEEDSDEALIELLRKALGDKDELEIRFERKSS